MIKFIQNEGDYFASNYFDEDFSRKVLDKSGYAVDDIKAFNKRLSPLRDRFFKYKQQFLEGRLRIKDKISITHQFNGAVLNALGYDGDTPQYPEPFHLSDTEVLPIRHTLYRGDKVHLMIMEMQALIKEGDAEPDGLFEQSYSAEESNSSGEQRYHRSQWADVFKIDEGLKISPVIINKAVSHLFLMEKQYRPNYILLLAGNKIFLLEAEKWFRGSYLVFDLEELFTEATTQANYYALLYCLIGKDLLAPDANMVLMEQLDEDSHKSAYEVTKDLKEGIIHAVEALANEAVWYLKNKNREGDFEQTLNEQFAHELKDDCLKMVYRLLFLFYAEAREDLDILPTKDSIYQKGYSLEMLRDLEQVQLSGETARNGYFFHESLTILFNLLQRGYQETDNDFKSFSVKHIDSPLFDDATFFHLPKVQIRNIVWQDIILRLSLSRRQTNKTRDVSVTPIWVSIN